MSTYRRSVDDDGFIQMSEHWKGGANETVDLVQGGAVVATVTVGVLHSIFDEDSRSYRAEATMGADGVVRGPGGVERPTNAVRKVYVGDLIPPPAVTSMS